MNATARGTAMIETAIVLSMVLLILFGAMQIAIWGYSQATTEGAAFVASHAASVNSSGTQSTDQTYGLSVANLAFPNVTSGQLNLTYPQTNVIQTVVTNTGVAGLLMVKGASPTITVSGGDIEPILANNADTVSTNSGFGAQATLANYCYFQNKTKTTCSARTIYIAQYDDIYGKGNGKNGQFAEWNCRPGLFPTYGGTSTTNNFPAAYPTTGGYNTQWDPGANTSTFFESNLYSFDTQTSSWGKQSSC